MLDTTLQLARVVSNKQPAHPIGPEPLIGKYVLLQRLEKAHYPDLYEALCTHLEIWTWWPDEVPSTPAALETYLDELEQSHPGDLAVFSVFLPRLPPSSATSLSSTAKALGLAFALSEHRSTHRVGELGLLLSPQLQRTTAATEIVFLLADLLFSSLNHRRVAWRTNALNTRSRRLAERCGFVHEGTFRQHMVDSKGRNRDTAWYAIIDSEWGSRRAAFEIWLAEGNFDHAGRQRRRLEEIRSELEVE